ncbi:hypothetical protein WSM22_22460 [Cytophagales bacterium WSM2-2]|nr:hypothetical protein WSM22_22460 [Cytophagales bacterium WSM2-2]
MEPAYRITDKWSVGLRLEGAVTSAAQSILTGSYGPNGQYYFLDKNGTRFFAGLGVGLYTLSSAGMMCDCSRDYEKNKIGFYPRLGFDVGHLTITTEYNVMSQVKLVGKSMIPNLNPVDNPTYVSYVSGNYFTAKIGVAIGGGKKKKE